MSKQIRTRAAGLGFAAAIAASAMPAAAQQFDATGTTFGAPTREIELNVSGSATYDSNLARSSDGGATTRGIEKEDVIFSPAVQGNVVLPTPAALLTLSGLVGYDFHARNTQLNRERIDLLAGAGRQVSICNVGVQAGYSRAQSDLADLSIVVGNPELSTVNVRKTMRIGGNASCGTVFRPTAYVDYRTSDNSATQRRISDVNTLTYGGGLSYSNPRFGVLTVFVGRSEFDYPERRGLAGSLQTFDVTMWGVRLDRRLGARLQVHGQLTYANVSGAGGASDAFDGLNWDASAALRIGERTQLTVGVLRQIDASAAFNLRTAQVSVYSAQLNYVFSPLLRGGVSALIRQRDFDNDPALAAVVLLGDDEVVEFGGRLAYSLGQRISINLNVRHQRRTADVAIYEYESFRAMIGASLRL